MMKSILFAVITIVCTASGVVAQPIHGHPQKAAYASPSEWPYLSAQCHADPPMAGMPLGMPGHTHIEARFPVWAELTGDTFTVPFTLKLFHSDARITYISGNSNDLINSITFDDPAWGYWNNAYDSDLHMAGDPTGLKTFTGKVTFNLLNARNHTNPYDGNYVPWHGWSYADLEVSTQYSNGTQTRGEITIPFFSMLDPSQPIQNYFPDTGFRKLSSDCFMINPSDPTTAGMGAATVGTLNYLPILAPIAAPETDDTFSYNYGIVSDTPASDSLLPGLYEERLDMDLHNGIPGTVIVSDTSQGVGGAGKTLPGIFDPAQMGPGAHKVTFLWQNTCPEPGCPVNAAHAASALSPGYPAEAVTALLALDVTVGDAVSPPPPPPPPPPPVTTCYIGTVRGTSIDNGATITPIGSIQWASATCQ